MEETMEATPEEFLSADHPFRKRPIAKVKKILGKQAYVARWKNPGENQALKEGMEIWFGDLVQTGQDTRIEMNLLERRYLYEDNPSLTSLQYSSTCFLRLDEETQGSLNYFPLYKEASPLITFLLKRGKVLVHLDVLQHQIAVRTPISDVVPAGNLYLVSHSQEGSWVGVLMEMVDVTLRNRTPATWSVTLIRGEQLFPYQMGATHLNLDTPQKTENNYPINEVLKIEPLITKFSRFPKDTQSKLATWGDRQAYRFEDYVRTRNELRRNHKTAVRQILTTTPSNTIESSTPQTRVK